MLTYAVSSKMAKKDHAITSKCTGTGPLYNLQLSPSLSFVAPPVNVVRRGQVTAVPLRTSPAT